MVGPSQLHTHSWAGSEFQNGLLSSLTSLILDCYGPLKCFQRTESNPNGPIPQCDGWGRSQVDYCYLPPDVTFPTQPPTTRGMETVGQDLEGHDGGELVETQRMPMQQLKIEIQQCTETQQCGLCQGDCDDDSSCMGSLVCFHRTWYQAYGEVTGCLGRGVAGKHGVAGYFVMSTAATRTNRLEFYCKGADYCAMP